MAAPTRSAPSARTAAASRNALSAPPLKATSTEPQRRAAAPRARPAAASSTCASSQAGNSVRSRSTTSVPGVAQLLLGAAAGQHRDAERSGRAGALDVVHVVADVDRRAVLGQHRPPCRPPRPRRPGASTSRSERLEVQRSVGAVLPGDHDAAAAVPAYGGQRLVRAGERRASARSRGRGSARGSGPPGRGARRPGSAARAAGPAAARAGSLISSTSSSTPVSSASTASVAANPGRVSISVMSRSNPTTSGAGGCMARALGPGSG